MYEFIRGKLVSGNPLTVVLEAGGVGYKLCVPTRLFSQLPQVGEETLLYTSWVVRETSQTLYGFLSEQERDLFETVLTISGIGPKTALSLIGHLPIHDLHNAILNHDVRAISKVPGIGNKTAERLIVDMRDKLSDSAFADTPSDFAIQVPGDLQRQKISDAMNALINLGYNQITAQKAIKTAMQDLSEETDLGCLITNALKHA